MTILSSQYNNVNAKPGESDSRRSPPNHAFPVQVHQSPLTLDAPSPSEEELPGRNHNYPFQPVFRLHMGQIFQL